MTAHFFDIETLLINDSKIWIVSKRNPSSPIMRISQSDFNLIRSGIYRSQGNLITFSGEDYWMPKDIFESLKIKCSKSGIDFSTLAFSMQEFMNKEVIDSTKYQLDIDTIRHLKNSEDHVFIICSKNTKSNYATVIEKLEQELAQLGIKIGGYYFISETFYDQNSDQIARDKVKILLQHITGFKSEENKFIDSPVDKYLQIHLYDCDQNTIKMGTKSNDFLKSMMGLSEESIENRIIDMLRQEDNIIYIHQVSSNKQNKLNTKKIELEYSKIIKTFEAFNPKVR